MAGRKDIHKDSKPFTKDDPRINRNGQPRKMFGQIMNELKEKGGGEVKAPNVQEAIEIVLALSEEEVSELAFDETKPLLLRIVAERLLDKDKRFEAIEKLLDRAHGKPKQGVEHSGEGGGAIAFVWNEIKTYEANDKTDAGA